MSKIHFATVIAVFVTASIATNLLVVGARGPVALGLPAALRIRSRQLGRNLKRLVDRRVAAMIARRERHAVMLAVHHLNDRDLKDIGIYRDRAGHLCSAGDDRRSDRRLK